jgi:hypothetical protein
MFCTTIPAVLALGVSAQAKQNTNKRETIARGETPQKPAIPAGPTTALVLLTVVAASIWVHSQSAG